MSHNWLLRTAALLTLLGIDAAPWTALADSPGTKIKIGVSASLSGDGAAYGTDVRNGILFANEKFGGGRFELIVEDDKCNGKDSVSGAQKLVNVDRVKYVVGYACSGSLLAAAPIYEKAQVLAMGTATSAAAISQAGKYIFRSWPSDLGAAQVLYDFVSLRHGTLGVVTEETEFAQGITRALLTSSRGGKLRVISETYLPGTADFRSLLARIKAAGADALFLNSQSEVALIPLYRQVLEMNIGLPVYSNYNAGNPEFLRAFGDRAEGVVFFDAPSLEQLANPNGARLYQEFVRRFGEAKSSSLYVLSSMAGFAALAEAILSGEDARSYMLQHSFSQVIDGLAFDEQGDPKNFPLVLKVIRGGKPSKLKNVL